MSLKGMQRKRATIKSLRLIHGDQRMNQSQVIDLQPVLFNHVQQIVAVIFADGQ